MSTPNFQVGKNSDQLETEVNLELTIHDQSIGNNLQELRQENIDVDIHITVGNKWNQKMFKAHTYVLKDRSDYFKAALSSQWARKDQNGIFIFRKENISPEVFDLILDYIYTGKISVALCNPKVDFVDFIEAAEELLLPRLVSSLEGHLIDTYLKQSPAKSLEIEAWLQSYVVRLITLKKDFPEWLNLVRSRFEEHVRKAGLDSIREVVIGSNTIEPKMYVNAILNVLNKYNHMVQIIFKNETSFVASFQKACREFINENKIGTKSTIEPAHLLVKFCDSLLCEGVENPGIDIENVINGIMDIFLHLGDKDIFREIYSIKLAKRLLTQCSVSEKAELIMLSTLKERCGFQYTSKLQSMFDDIGVSKNLNYQFKEFLDTNDSEQVDLVFVIKNMSWPWVSIPFNLNIPEEMEQNFHNFQRFKSFYTNKHSSRMLNLLPQFSIGELKANYLKTSKVFQQMSTCQMNILLQYNKDTSYTFSELHQSTGISQEFLISQLNYLVITKILLLENEKCDTKKYTLNFDFNSKKSQIILNDPEIFEYKEKISEISEISEEKKYHIEKIIIRVVKDYTRGGGISNNALISEICKQALNKYQFRAKIPDIKKAIYRLIEKEYIECTINA